MKAFGDTYQPFTGLGFALVTAPCLLAALPAVTVETRLGAPSRWRQEGLFPLGSVGKEVIHGTPPVALPHDYPPTKQMSLASRPGNPEHRSLFFGGREGSGQGTRSASPRLLNHHLGHQAFDRLGKTKLYGIPAFVQRRSELASSGSRSPQESTTPSRPTSASGEYQQGHREQGAGGTDAGAVSKVLGPWVVPTNVRVKKSELEAGRLHILSMARELVSGEADTRGGPEDGGPLTVPSATHLQAKSAFEKLFPLDTVYYCRDENEQFRVLGVGPVLGIGGAGVVCRAADITNLTRARNLAAKFFYFFLDSDSKSDVEYGKKRIGMRELDGRRGREKVLSKVSSEMELTQHGIALSHGFYTLDWSRRPPSRQMDVPLLSYLPGGKGGDLGTSSYVLFGRRVMIMPLLGPDLAQFPFRDFTANALKYVFVTLVRRVAYFNSVGLVHRDIKPGNIAVSFETGELFLTDLDLVTDMGAKSRCRHYLTCQYADPERAKCIVDSDGEFLVDEWVDSWALGVTLFTILCREEYPFGSFMISTKADRLERFRENHKVFLQ
ncbi:rhoptry kinase family protein rop37 (incomplete catalytic triad), partial [Cystoisospora suis]